MKNLLPTKAILFPKNAVRSTLKSVVVIVATTIIASFASATPHKGSDIVMSSASRYAVAAGEKIAAAGGNAVDVAITMALTMSVTNASFAALGGGGFAVVRMGKETQVLDFREVAPKATHEKYYLNKKEDASTSGGAAVAVPGNPAGYYELHKKYGKVHWSRLFDEPVALAKNGFRIGGEWLEDLDFAKENLNSAAKKAFLDDDGKFLKPGYLLKQPNLARALQMMRNRNVIPFYDGEIAQDLVDTVKASGGELSIEDLKNYKPKWRQPLTTEFNGYKLYLMPPPSSGGIVIKRGLALVETLKLKDNAALSANEFHMLGQILSRAFQSRTMIADPDFYKVPVDEMTNATTISALAKSISPKVATTMAPAEEGALLPKESRQTTHLSVLDKDGNAVAMTITLNGEYGSGVMSEKFGIMLNNEMDDFTTKPGVPNMFGLIQGQGNVVTAGKRPLSSMSPTLVEKNGKVIMAIGAPGGPRIISSVFQVLYRTLGLGWNVEDAVLAPRVHHQLLPNKLLVETNKFSPEILTDLKQRKNDIKEDWMAKVYVIQNVDGVLNGYADVRGEGFVGGY